MNKTRTATATPSIVHSSAGTGPFEVRYTIEVDRPWLRGATYAPVAPGSKVHMTERFTSQTAAVRRMDAILRGDDDFLSEYVPNVQVFQRHPSRGLRTIRRRVERSIYRAPSVTAAPELARPALAAHASAIPGRRMVFMSATWDTSHSEDLQVAAAA